MDVSVYNIVVNYFLINPQKKSLSYQQLKLLIDGVKKNLCVNIVDQTVDDIKNMVIVFSDFLSIDSNLTIYQHDILQYLDELQPVCQRFGEQKWENQYNYYNYIRQFKTE